VLWQFRRVVLISLTRALIIWASDFDKLGECFGILGECFCKTGNLKFNALGFQTLNYFLNKIIKD